MLATIRRKARNLREPRVIPQDPDPWENPYWSKNCEVCGDLCNTDIPVKVFGLWRWVCSQDCLIAFGG